jgi:hypothetical protein
MRIAGVDAARALSVVDLLIGANSAATGLELAAHSPTSPRGAS